MKYRNLYHILARTISVEFYRLHAGFFFIVLACALGTLRPIEHIALASYIVNSYFLLSCLFLIWTLYTIKTVRFTLATFTSPRNQFLYHLYLFPDKVKISALLLVQVLVYQPVIWYAAFMGYYALEQQRILSLILLICFVLFSVLAAVLFYVQFLKSPGKEHKISRLSMYIHLKYVKPYFTYYLYEVFHTHFSTFGLAKTFSLALIPVVIELYIIEHYSQVLLSIGMLIVFSMNAVLAFHFNRFEQVTILMFKNMPLSPHMRFVYNILTYSCLLLPEILLLIRYLANSLPVESGFVLILFAISLQLVFHSYVLYRQQELDIFIRHVFFIFLFYFICLLFRMDVLFISVVNIAIAYISYLKYFYLSEVIIIQEKKE